MEDSLPYQRVEGISRQSTSAKMAESELYSTMG